MLDHEVPGGHAQQSKLDTKIRELVFQRGQWIRRNPGKINIRKFEVTVDYQI